MDTKSYTVRVPKRWARIALIVGVTALIVAPLSAVATHSGFTDVPDSHTFVDDIAWLKAADVTRGCNPPANTLYCPEDNVTRGQMAAFMQRFANYLGANDGTPAQADNAENANTLDGKDGSEYEVFVGGTQETWRDDGTTVPVAGQNGVELAQLQIEMAADGFVAVTGNATVRSFPATTQVSAIWIQINDTTCESGIIFNANAYLAGTLAYGEFDTDVSIHSLAGTGARALSAGTHTATLCVSNEFAGDSADVFDAGLTAVGSSSGNATVTAQTSGASVDQAGSIGDE